jgi:hypothetical protein
VLFAIQTGNRFAQLGAEDHNLAGKIQGAQMSDELQPVHIGHVVIGYHEVEIPIGCDSCESESSVVEAFDLMPIPGQRDSCDIAQLLQIVSIQDPKGTPPDPRRGGDGGIRGRHRGGGHGWLAWKTRGREKGSVPAVLKNDQLNWENTEKIV